MQNIFWTFVIGAALAQSASAFESPAFSTAPLLGNQKVNSFSAAKDYAEEIHRDHAVTIYCPCQYQGDQVDLPSCGYEVQSRARDKSWASKLQWEHVVPAESFGQAFPEWRQGAVQCGFDRKGKPVMGRKCAETNPQFSRMEADLYNLWPIIAELNNLRRNYSMAQIAGPARTFGGCQAKIQDNKFEPMDIYKGIVARTYLYMDLNYPGRGVLSDRNQKLMEAWDRQFPVTAWECERARRIERIQGNPNQILKDRCSRR